MRFFRLLPEVAGELGEKSIITYKNGMIESVQYLHYVLKGWLGDEVITQTPCFMISQRVLDELSQQGITGCKVEQMLVTISDEFQDSDKELPSFVRLLPQGTIQVKDGKVTKWSGHDICLEDEVELVVSERAFNTISKYCNYCDIEELT